MTEFSLRQAEEADIDAVVAACAEAFTDEAVYAWAVTDPATAAGFFHATLVPAIRARQVLLAETDAGMVTGTAIWVDLDTAAPIHAEAAVLATMPGTVGGRIAAVAAATAAVHPDEPHLFLSAMAVRPPFRGRGTGAALLSHTLAEADERRRPAYLEASTARSRELYLRHGFRDTGEPIQLPDAGPRLYPMWRPSPPRPMP